MVCGLTFRWVIKRVVKNHCNKAGRSAGSRIQALPSFLQPLGGCPQQFRSAGQIPIGVGNVSMSEIGGQDGQAPLGVLAIAIPAQQSFNRKSVTKIVQARAPAGTCSTQPNLSGQGTSAGNGSWADFPPFPRMVIWPVLQSMSSKLSPTTSPARTPSLASSSKMAWFRLPTDVFRSQHSRIRSTSSVGRNLGSVDSDQLGTVGTQLARSVVIVPRQRR